ncbi:MAG: glycosyltransferase family 2 protein [Gemmataceae bacterium]|nr:glycosyltransferase family 2 protein [Gemmataceae bacterium]
MIPAILPHKSRPGARQQATIDLTLFVACYNEEPNIIATIETVVAAVDEIGCSYEIIVIDDASTDASARVVRDYQAAHPDLPIVLKQNPVNRGLARNFVAAAFLGRGTRFKLVCGDNVESKDALVRILRRMNSAELVLSYHDRCRGRGWGRTLLSRAYTWLVNLLSGHSLHYYNGLPLYLRSHVLQWHSSSTGFGFQADLVTRLLDEGVTYCEVQVEARDRTAGRSQALTPRNFVSVGNTLLRIAMRRVGRLIQR